MNNLLRPLYLVFMYLLLYLPSLAFGEERFVFVVVSYNDASSVNQTLESIRKQIVPAGASYELVFMNDGSTDDTGKKAEDFIEKYDLSENWFVFHNATHKGRVANYYNVINMISPSKIIVIVNGGDQLINENVLVKLTTVYRRQYEGKKIWMTYGSFLDQTGNAKPRKAFSSNTIIHNAFRKHPFYESHLLTFYAELFRGIKKVDLCWEDDFMPCCAEVAITLPLLEKCSKGHFRFIKRALYIRTSHAKESNSLKKKILSYICSKKPYYPLESLD